MLDTYYYGWDVDICIVTQQDVLGTSYTPDCPGGELGFLEDYENAFINIDAVSPTELYTDEGKCHNFITNFSLINHTADMADDSVAQTTTWDELASYLRRKLALLYA